MQRLVVGFWLDEGYLRLCLCEMSRENSDRPRFWYRDGLEKTLDQEEVLASDRRRYLVGLPRLFAFNGELKEREPSYQIRALWIFWLTASVERWAHNL